MDKKAMAYLWASVTTRIFIKIVLVILIIVSFLNQSTSSTVLNASTQRTRIQLIVKDVLILQYIPSGYAQAYSELQTTFPGWQQEEAALQAIPDSDIQIAVNAANSDYTQITAALHAILAQPNRPVNPLQVTIIRMHEIGYRSALNQVIMFIQQEVIIQRTIAFFVVLGIFALIIVLSSIDIVVVGRILKREGLS